MNRSHTIPLGWLVWTTAVCRNLICICLLLGLCTSVLAQAPIDSTRLKVSIRLGYTQTDFDWSIAGDADGQNPNIYSELIWKNVSGIRTGGEVAWQFHHRMSLCISFDHTFTQSGSATDSDYASDNREDRTFFAKVDSDHGKSLTFIPRLGYRFAFRSLSITPLIGFSLNRQYLTLRDNDESHFKGLKSSYDMSWQGWNVGVATTFDLLKKFLLSVEVNYHQLKYRGEGNWNLVETFEHPVSYRQRANGFSIASCLEIQYQLNGRWGVGVGANMLGSKTAKGVDTLFLTDGQKPQTQFNGATQKNWSAFAAITFRI